MRVSEGEGECAWVGKGCVGVGGWCVFGCVGCGVRDWDWSWGWG